jgi:flagellum-specific peptidoglycan hydrolase FlgJ
VAHAYATDPAYAALVSAIAGQSNVVREIAEAKGLSVVEKAV